MVEGIFLAICGGLLGLLVAVWAGDALLRFLPAEGVADAFRTTPDARVLGFTLLLSCITGIVFSLIPALQATRPDVAPALKDSAVAVASGGSQVRFRKGLVVTQFALCLLLLVGTGLFARSLYNLRNLNPGIHTDKLVTFAVDPALNGYDQNRVVTFLDRALQSLAGIPGVDSVSLAKFPLLANSRAQSSVKVEGYRSKEGEDMNPSFNVISPGHFATIGLPLLAGRDFRENDGKGAPKVAIINDTMARYFFKNESPLGRHLAIDNSPAAKLDIEIVGVVKDNISVSLREEPARWVFIPAKQWDRHDRVQFYLRTSRPETAILPAIRTAMRNADANLPLFNLKTMTTQVNELLFVDRLIAVLAAGFGLLATLLAAVGLYGITAYSVARRTKEIGIRVALGAKTRDVLRLMMKEVAIMTMLGIVLGIPIAIGLSRYIQSQLYGLEANDPATLAAASLLLALIALTAGYIPARRASLIEPLKALHHE
jgi:predicted permease